MWDMIAGAVKGFGDTLLGFVKEFHLNPKDAADLEQKMREATMTFQRDMWQLEAQDRDSARKRETTLNDPTTRRLAYLYTGGYFATFFCLISGAFTIQQDVKQLVDVLMAVLTAGQYSILAYYFGSSHGSSNKDAVIDRAMQVQQDGK